MGRIKEEMGRIKEEMGRIKEEMGRNTKGDWKEYGEDGQN